jgi:hypothetical protein
LWHPNSQTELSPFDIYASPTKTQDEDIGKSPLAPGSISGPRVDPLQGNHVTSIGYTWLIQNSARIYSFLSFVHKERFLKDTITTQQIITNFFFL